MKFYTLFFFLATCFINTAYADVDQYFHSIQNHPEKRSLFLKQMPKGGELHYHLAGGAYPEAMLSLLLKHPYCLDPKTATISPYSKACNGVKSHLISRKKKLIAHILRAWSMKDFDDTHGNAHDHFFSAFGKFNTLVSDFRAQLLVDVMKRAAAQNEHYLEVMILPDDAQSASFAPLIANQTSLKSQQKTLLNHTPYRNNIQHTLDQTESILNQARRILRCPQTLHHEPACELTIKFQYYILREQPIDHFFAQALNGFIAASFSSEIVGINVVQAEDGPIALKDYQKQMAVLGFLKTTYPSVNIALHAGELTSKIAPETALTSHIHDAIFQGNAKRIGHGVSIFYEHKRDWLIDRMAKIPIPVEINLTSNQTILGIEGKQHPLNFYIKHHVPVVLSTDDEGILQTDLTHQFSLAAEQHGLDYSQLKQINRNTLTYSFLPGDSLWQDPDKAIPVKACRLFSSKSCHNFLTNNPKATAQWHLEKKLLLFENQF